MEKKKTSAKKTSTKTVKKKKNTTKRTKKNNTKKGFTLVEILAVIIILGILMMIAVPAVSKYVNNSRKSTYVNTAKAVMEEAKSVINEEELSMYDLDTTYYLPYEMLKLEKGNAKSPYGDFVKAYVVVTYDGEKFDYYWTSVDTTNTGVMLTKYDDLDESDIESDFETDRIKTSIGVCGKNNIVVFKADGTINKDESGLASINSCFNTQTNTVVESENQSVSGNSIMVAVEQENEGRLSVGDEISIADRENFYVVTADQEKTVLLAKYNLYVGYRIKRTSVDGFTVYNVDNTISTSDPKYGYQSSLTTTEGVGVVPFSGKNYWQSAPNSSNFKSEFEDGRNRSIYSSSMSSVAPQVKKDGNNVVAIENDYSIAYYVQPYIQKIRAMGVNVVSGGLLSNDQASSLGCSGNTSCSYYSNRWLRNTSFWVSSVAWTGSASSMDFIKYISKNGSYGYTGYKYVNDYGVRPTITVKTSDIQLQNHEYFENKPVYYD